MASSEGLDVRDISDELERVRPGIPGRRRGERYAAGGFKERAKLAMAMPWVVGGCGGGVCWWVRLRWWGRQSGAKRGGIIRAMVAGRCWCSRGKTPRWVTKIVSVT